MKCSFTGVDLGLQFSIFFHFFRELENIRVLEKVSCKKLGQKSSSTKAIVRKHPYHCDDEMKAVILEGDCLKPDRRAQTIERLNKVADIMARKQ